MIGGSGEKKTLRMVAQYADASNFFGDVERIRHLVGVLEGHCERLGRDPAEITKTRLGTVIIAPTQDEADAPSRIREAQRHARRAARDMDRRRPRHRRPRSAASCSTPASTA